MESASLHGDSSAEIHTKRRPHRTVGITSLTAIAVSGALGLPAVLATPASAAVGAAAPTLSVTATKASWIAAGQEQPFYAAMLGAIGAPVTAANLQVMEAWARAEGSRSAYNPWNTTQRTRECAYQVDSNNSTAFATAECAVAAMKRQLESLYKPVVAAFVAGNPEQTVAAIVASPWAGSQYGAGGDWRKSLIWRVYVGLPAAGWKAQVTTTTPNPGTSPGAVPVSRAWAKKRRIVFQWAGAPSSGLRVKRYEIRVRQQHPSTRSWAAWQSQLLPRSARTGKWAKLDRGYRYQVTIRAHNKAGPGPWSVRHNFWL